MTLNDILVSALAQLDRGNDPQTLDVWRDKFTRFANDAQADLASAILPCRREDLAAVDGVLDLTALARKCTKVVGLKLDGKDVPIVRGADSWTLAVDTDGTYEVTYRYQPRDLTSPSDESELPAHCHGLIVTYVVARERMSGDRSTQAGSNIYFELYQTGKAKLRPHVGDPAAYRIINKY